MTLCLLGSCKDTCGLTRRRQQRRRDTWWWNTDVKRVVKEKKDHEKRYEKGTEENFAAKRRAKSVSALLKRIQKYISSATYT